ncbi:hypothetical protein C1645_831288 [Glomus cerebriforme]|uniref:Uncharacterized protein n=1 Tax=Glomus cerebriforme TaxID=658196 RepID=A0A397SHQ3_9GLOM|nr:hypothetical protein C1645_831288 [Glomus cerebriforme]
MSTQQRPTQKFSRKKVEDTSINTSNNFDYGHIPQRPNEYEKTESIPQSIHSSGKEGLENYVLSRLRTLGSHFPDNPEIHNLVTIIKKGRRKERLNQLDNLAKERRKKQQQLQQQQQQQYPLTHYLDDINDDDLSIKAQENLRFKHNTHGSKGARIQNYQESDIDQVIDVNQERHIQMDDYTMNQKNFDINRLPRTQSPKPTAPTIITAPPPPNTGIRNSERQQVNKGIVPKSKKYDSRDTRSYMNYKAKLQDKARRKQEFELIRKQIIKEETNRRLRQLEEFRRKQRKEKMAQFAKNRELKLDEDIIDDEYKEFRKQQRRERMAEIARESRNPSINDSQEPDNEDIEYWESLTPDSIGWKEFLSLSKSSKENNKPQISSLTLNTDQFDKYQENILNALTPEKSFRQILNERYTLQPVIDKNEKPQRQIRDEKNEAPGLSHPKENESEPSKLVGVQVPKLQENMDKKKLKKDSQQIPQSFDQKISFNQPKLQQKIQEEKPISKPPLKSTQRLHVANDSPQSNAKVRGWLKHSEEFDETENKSKIPPPSHNEEYYSGSEDFSSDDETLTIRDSKSLRDLLSKIRSTKKKINSQDKVSLERHQRTLEVMQRIVTDLIEKHEEIIKRDKKMKDGKKHVRELLNTITGKNTRDIIDALSQSLDQPPDKFDATSNSLDALLKQLRKATEGLKNVEEQLTRKEKRLKTALEVAQDLVDKRLNLINWERRLKQHEQSVNKISSRISESRDSSMINQQNDESGYIGSILGSFFGKKNSENNKIRVQERVDNTTKPRANSSPSKLQKVYTEEEWEKILVCEDELDASPANDEEFDKNVENSQSAEINKQKQDKDENLSDIKSGTTIQSSSSVNQMTVISQMDEYLLLLARQEKMKEYLDKIGDNQQSIKDYLSKVDNNHDNNCSVINSEYFRTNMSIEEITRTEVKDDNAPAEKNFDKGKERQVINFTPTLPTLPTFDHLTNETEPNIEDSDSDSDWEKLTSRFNVLSSLRNKIVKPKPFNHVSRSTPLNKFPNRIPTTESLARNDDWEKLLLRIQNKSHLQKTPSFLKDEKGNKANTSNSNFFVNTEGKIGGIFANISQTSSAENVKDFKNDENPKTQMIDAKNNIGAELKSNLTNMRYLVTNQKDTLTSERSSSLNLGDYVSRSFPVPVISQQIHEKVQKESTCEQMNSMTPQKELEIPKDNFEETQKEINTNIKDKDSIIETSDNVNNHNGIMSESGLDFSEVVNNLPDWKSFVFWLKGNVK